MAPAVTSVTEAHAACVPGLAGQSTGISADRKRRCRCVPAEGL